MNKPKISTLIYTVGLAICIVGCTATQRGLSEGSEVLMANDRLIRFAYSLNSDALHSIDGYASEHCASTHKRAVQGTRTCDGDRCEIAYFCEE